MTRADVAPVKVISKAQLWREIGMPLSNMHGLRVADGCCRTGWASCDCDLAILLRRLDEMLRERPKLRRKRAER